MGSVRKSKITPKAIESSENQLKAIRLRKEGYTYEQIGEELGVSGTTAYNLVKQAFDLIQWNTHQEARVMAYLIIERNNEALNAMWESIVDGEIQQTETMIRLQTQMIKVLGIERLHVDITTNGESVSGPMVVLPKIIDDGELDSEDDK